MLTPQQILVSNEQVKLTANATNASAVALMIGGGAGTYAAYGAPSDPWAIGRAVFWIAVGGFIHRVARRILRNLL